VTILILSNPEDEHADAVELALDRRGEAHVRVDPAEFPDAATLSVEFSPSGLRSRVLTLAGRVVRLDEVTAVWLRRPGRPGAGSRYEGTAVGDVMAEETAAVLTDLWDTLDVPHLPGPRSVVQRAQYKLRQLQLAAELGLELPPTLVTSDPDALLEFAERYEGLITKQAGSTQVRLAPDGDPFVRYTEQLLPSDLAHVEALTLCPLIVQAYVPKLLELRVTVVGSRVLAAAIHSQTTNHTRHDWRRYDNAHTLMEPWDLPAEIANALLELNARLGVRYSASDFILTPDGRYVYLETNPSGQYLWVEDATGLPITEAIVDVLVGASLTTEVLA
jgi:glutathione synthase/RimK-type ligase-like ATP-grasp enzyme